MTQNLYIFLAFALAVIGGVLGSSLGRSHRRLCALISLGAGTLFGVTVFGILPESIESLHWWGLLLAPRAPKVTVTRERVSLCQKGVTLWLLFLVNCLGAPKRAKTSRGAGCEP